MVHGIYTAVTMVIKLLTSRSRKARARAGLLTTDKVSITMIGCPANMIKVMSIQQSTLWT